MTASRCPRLMLAGLLPALLLGLLVVLAAAPAEADPDHHPGILHVQTVPSVRGARITVDGREVRTDRHGRASVRVRNFEDLKSRFDIPWSRVSPTRVVRLDRILGSLDHGVTGRTIRLGLRIKRRVQCEFTDTHGRAISPDRVSLLEIRSSTGEVVRLTRSALRRPVWLAAGKSQQTRGGLGTVPYSWSITRAIVDGSNVVIRGQQVYRPSQTLNWPIRLLFFRVHVVGRDLLLGSLAGAGVDLTRPDGVEARTPFTDGRTVLSSVPRGSYQMRVYGGGLAFTRPVAISKNQLVEIQVLTPSDLALLAGLVVLVALSFVLVGRRRLVLATLRRLRRRGRKHAAAAMAVAAVLGCALTSTGVPQPAQASPVHQAHGPIQLPTFAYYYIWYQHKSWRRAKIDYPLIGRYSSDSARVMRRHVEMAKQAGLTGFLVSWKVTPSLDSRLDMLVRICHREHFKLEVVYQGLDFERHPLPVQKVAADLRYFRNRYAANPVFDTFGKPVVVITGTEQYTVRQLRRITTGVRDKLFVLASAKNVKDYRRTRTVTDGDAYYWSSADPRHPFYLDKMKQMGRVVRSHGGLWLAPAASGYDGRALGGHQVVDPRGGRTLRRAVRVAVRSHPDAIGVISWNEFSENSQVEPSVKLGDTELVTLASLLGGHVNPRLETFPPAKQRARPAPPPRTGFPAWAALAVLLAAL
ncbi:MAG: hypothetical protein ACRDPB_04675, partial [Nocardioidaceae bacterium]